jgi:hypothetical protein
MHAKMYATYFWSFYIGCWLKIQISEKLLPHCTEVKNGIGEEMGYLFGAIIKTCSLAGIDSNFKTLWITAYTCLFQVICDRLSSLTEVCITIFLA